MGKGNEMIYLTTLLIFMVAMLLFVFVAISSSTFKLLKKIYDTLWEINNKL